MAKESTLTNLVMTLVIVTIASALGLGGMNVLTADPIAQAKQQKILSALKEVLPEFDNNPAEEMSTATVDGEELRLYPATLQGERVGTAVESFSPAGFGGRIAVMVGFDAEGKIAGYSVLEHGETPGLGDKMVDWFKPPTEPVRSLVEKAFGFNVPVPERKSNVYGINPGETPLQVSKDGGTVDAITAATISSRAFLDALNRAYKGLEAQQSTDQQTEGNTPKKEEATQ